MQKASSIAGLAGVKDTGIVFLTKLIAIGAGVANQAALAWFLAPAGRGEFAVCASFALVVAVILSLGFDRAIQYHMINGRLQVREALPLALAMSVVTSGLIVAAGWFLVQAPVSYFEKAPIEAFRFALLLVPAVSIHTALSLLLTGLRAFRLAAVEGLVVSALNVGLVLLLVGLLSWDVQGAILAWVVASSVGTAIQLAGIGRHAEGRWRLPTGRTVAAVLGYGSRYYFARLGNVVNVQIGLVVVAFLAPQAQIGLFAAAYFLVDRILLLPDSLNTALQPRIGAARDGRPELTARACRMSFLLVGACLAVVVVSAPLVVPVLLSPEFASAVPLIWVLAAGVWLRAAVRPLSAYFIGTNRPGVVSWTTALECGCSATLVPLLYAAQGLVGAALGVAIADVIATTARVLVFRRVAGCPVSALFLPTVEDASQIKGVLRALAGRRPQLRIFYDLKTADEHAGGTRQTILLADRVVKRQSPDLTRLEAEKTLAGAAIGRRTGTFHVPELLKVDGITGVLESRRVEDVTTVWEYLRTGGTADALLVRVAAALAAIHRELRLPEELSRALPDRYLTSEQDSHVFLHGDFDAFNVLVQGAGRDIVITDWATSDLIGAGGTRGPAFFDLAWFAGSLFTETRLGTHRLPDAGRLMRVFCDAYADHLHATARAAFVEGFYRYSFQFARQLDALRGARWSRRLTQFRARAIATSRFERSLRWNYRETCCATATAGALCNPPS